MLVESGSEVGRLLTQIPTGRELGVDFVTRSLTALEGELPGISRGNSALSLPEGLTLRPGAAQILSGNLTRAVVTGGRHTPLHFVHSGPAPVTVALHRSGSQPTTVTVPRNGLLIFPGDVGYSIDAGHTVVLVGDLEISPSR